MANNTMGLEERRGQFLPFPFHVSFQMGDALAPMTITTASDAVNPSLTQR
jgi:hypothetical protein